MVVGIKYVVSSKQAGSNNFGASDKNFRRKF